MSQANRVRRPLELSGILERADAIYLVHVAIDPGGRASRVRVTAATDGGDQAVLGAGTVLTWRLSRGGTLAEVDLPGPIIADVARIAAEIEAKGAAIAAAAIRFAERRLAREAPEAAPEAAR